MYLVHVHMEAGKQTLVSLLSNSVLLWDTPLGDMEYAKQTRLIGQQAP